MTEMINPLGWPTTWNMEYASTSEDLHLYEYGNTGTGADMSGRADWAGIRALTETEAADYTAQVVMAGNDNWDPQADPPAVTVYTWTGGGALFGWKNTNNWDPAQVPALGEAANVDCDCIIEADGGIFEADLNLMNGAVLNVTASSEVVYMTAGKATIAASTDVALAGKIKTKDTLTLDVSGNLAMDAGILGIHKIIKEGSGSVSLNGNNANFYGNWIIEEGTLSAAAANSLGEAGVEVKGSASLSVSDANAFFPQSPLRVASTSIINLDVDIVLSEFYIDGVMQAMGDYNASTNPELITGTGKITVGRPNSFTFIGGADGKWDNPDHYVPALMPEEGETVNCDIEMETTSTVYTANIYFSSGGRLRLRGTDTSTGEIHFADGTSIGYNTSGSGFSITAPMFFDGDVILNMESSNTSGCYMKLGGPVSGSGKVSALNNGKSDVVNTGTVHLLDDNSGFDGTWDLTLRSTKYPDLSLISAIEAAAPNALGNGKVQIGDNALLVLNNMNCAGDKLDVSFPGSGKINLKTNVLVKELYFDDIQQAEGVYDATSNPDIIQGSGRIIVSSTITLPESPSDLSATEILHDQVSIEWTNHATNADGHLVNLDGKVVDTVDTNTAVVTGLERDTEYTIGVAAYNILGTSEDISIDVTTLRFPLGENNQLAEKVRIMPNPVKDLLQIQGVSIKQWTIVKITGQAVETGSGNELDTSGLKAGTYILQLSTTGGETGSIAFVKE